MKCEEVQQALVKTVTVLGLLQIIISILAVGKLRKILDDLTYKSALWKNLNEIVKRKSNVGTTVKEVVVLRETQNLKCDYEFFVVLEQ